MIGGSLIKVLGWNDLLDDLLFDLLAELLSGDVLAVLGRDNNCVNTDGNDGTAIMSVLNCDLGLGVGPQPWEASVVSSLLHGGVELVREEECQGEQLWGLVGGISKHDTLVTSTKLLKGFIVVQTLGNVGRLLLNGNEHIAGLVVKALGGVVVADVLDGTTDDLLVVKVSLGGDLAKNHNHARLGSRFTGHLGERIFSEAGIEDGIGDLITGQSGQQACSTTVVSRRCWAGKESRRIMCRSMTSDTREPGQERRVLTRSCRGGPRQQTRM